MRPSLRTPCFSHVHSCVVAARVAKQALHDLMAFTRRSEDENKIEADPPATAAKPIGLKAQTADPTPPDRAFAPPRASAAHQTESRLGGFGFLAAQR